MFTHLFFVFTHAYAPYSSPLAAKVSFVYMTKDTFLSDAFLLVYDAHFVRDVGLRSVMHAFGA